ncbi:putative L-ascorbate peroxidase 6 [Rutidosis leptorrhynchoides]|uniref:putative L-ascorbate peroxidase 6 n=1 Tax=Rutidosis leptorrhynchoides TaxID=125765 RepID=UPI003A990264
MAARATIPNRPLKMMISTANGVLCCSSINFPAKLQRQFGAKPIAASLSTSSIDDSNKDQALVLDRRRLVLSLSASPLLLLLNNSAANAAEIDESDYLGIMKEEIRKVVTKNKAPGILRLAFHDAGTFEMNENSGGMNGSIVYELDRPENAGLKKPVKILEKAKSQVDALKPVSWADMIAVGGAEAVSVCGGPQIPVQLGRLDLMKPDAEGKLPEETLDASGLKKSFQRKGFSTQELVALSGAHTLGSKGFGNPTVFDNSYYKILLEKPWMSSAGMTSMIGLPSDRALVEDDDCVRWIKLYAEDQDLFFEDFKNAYIKLVNSGASWKNT